MRFFDRFRRRRGHAVSGFSAATLAELAKFLETHDGVEGYLEPPTAVYVTITLCLVAADGQFVRRPIKDERQAYTLCGQHRVPVYDARKVGYPKRMRDYQRGTPHRKVSLDDLPPLD